MTLIALTGATGYIGRFVVAELQQQGFTIRALARPESDLRGFAAPIEWIPGDLRSDAALAALVNGASAVVHLAYEHVPGRYRGGEGDNLPAWLDANLSGSLRLIHLAAEAGVESFIFLSSRAVFSGALPGRELDESHPTNPDTHYGAYKAAVEAFLSSYGQRGILRTCAIRATGVYGLTWPLERSKWWDLVQAVLHDQPLTTARGGTEVHGADVAKVVSHVLRHPGPQTDVIHMSDLYLTYEEIVRRIRHYANRPGMLPPPSAPEAASPLVCHRLAEMGINLGGSALFEDTLAALVEAATRNIQQ